MRETVAISDSFDALISRLHPSDRFNRSASKHVATIKAALKDSPALVKLDVVGSFGRETFVLGGSDIDLFAVITRKFSRWGEAEKSSTTVLNWLRLELVARYPTVAIGRDGHAVVVRFSDGNVDIVPAIYGEAAGTGHPIYRIPDAEGGWMPTSPPVHSKYIDDADEASRWKLKKTVQLLKFWRSQRVISAALRSFYIEMVLASEGVAQRPQSYAVSFTEALGCLAKRRCRGLRDPKGISGNITAADTSVRLNNICEAVDRSLALCHEALAAEEGRDTPRARELWRRVFNGTFPA